MFSEWESEETTGRAIEIALQQCLAGDCPAWTEPEEGDDRGKIVLPIFGKIVASPIILATIAGIGALAFTVSSIEFV